MIAAILHHYPALHGILFDVPHVTAAARAKLAACGLAGRCRFEAGNFFDGIPEDADAHLLKQVIHDWDDSQAVRLLTRCRQALPPAGTLLIIERVLPDHAMPGQATDDLLDLEMLIGSGGRERTAAEFRALLSATGFDRSASCQPPHRYRSSKQKPSDEPAAQIQPIRTNCTRRFAGSNGSRVSGSDLPLPTSINRSAEIPCASRYCATD